MKYLHPVSILIEIGLQVRKKCVQKCLFFALSKKLQFSRRIITPQKCNFWPKHPPPPDAQCRFLLEVKQMPH